MIWSRGRLGGRIRYLFLAVLVWTIFLAGGVFQANLTEGEKETELTYLKDQNKSVLLESVSAATFASEKKLLDKKWCFTNA